MLLAVRTQPLQVFRLGDSTLQGRSRRLYQSCTAREGHIKLGQSLAMRLQNGKSGVLARNCSDS